MLKKGLINLGILPIFLFNNFTLISLKNQPPSPVESYKPDPATLFNQGKQYYHQGQYTQAADILQQAILGFSQQGDIVNQAIALSNLSLVLQQLGQWEQAEKVLQESLGLIQDLSFPKQPLILAQILEIQGQLEFTKGQPEQAIKTWKQAFKLYSQTGNWLGEITNQINQATALQTLGLYRQSLKTLTEVNETLKSQPNSLIKVTALLSLGNALKKVGDLKTAQAVLQHSLELAKTANYSQVLSRIYLSLANLNRAQNNSDLALENYQNAVKTASNGLERLQGLINQYSLLIDLKQYKEAETLSQEIQDSISQIPVSRSLVYAMVNFTNSLIKLNSTSNDSKIIDLLKTAIQSSKTLKDLRSESYALGSLGKFYEQNQQPLEAQKLTEQALLIAQSINASDIAYQWQWQLGRLLKQQNQKQEAIAAYTEAVNTLKFLRKDLVAINQDVQFSFRESVEPVYRELVDLILQSPTPDNLKTARELIESLQLAELDNFFQEACLDQEIKPQEIDQIDPNAAIIYPIILANRLEVILSIPGQDLRHYSTEISQQQVENTIRQLRLSFQPIFSTKERLELSQTVYNWLIRPAESDLKNSSIKTLVFVLDGSLRNVPMAALYDGKNYLVQNYNLALTPGLQLLASQSLKRNQLKALTVGLSEARQGFSALPAVASELEKIEAEVPTKVLLNQQFTREAVQQQIQETAFPIVHLATHGQFSSKAEDTFLLTWDSRINVKDLDDFLSRRQRGEQNPVELLVLSACETATGDQRAALGLAGVAVRSGARSTLATLWQVNDISTASLMAEFYQELTQQQISKAEALRQAQLKLLQQAKYQDPYYWAPFVLVGNWQ
ncbi:CHAT domain-containing protein [Planktothrix mougeotii]|uniref:CHAT domain-containing protein n=1 Tax=Planktothrix mougeotii LEGE 06226 TaxID=1828728 RepID=A0ABR9UDQ1_9CYAN|nr:CHAT domain-containing protein [Planktothrix mougeotii]MBE9144593.1 CHAT domain-containing protein [Planktothrix mougeotii LEGE 06226]